jgi:hypothetical protein
MLKMSEKGSKTLISLLAFALSVAVMLGGIIVSVKLNLFNINYATEAFKTVYESIFIVLGRIMFFAAMVCIWFKANVSINFRLLAFLIAVLSGMVIYWGIIYSGILVVRALPDYGYGNTFDTISWVFGYGATFIIPWQLIKRKDKLLVPTP